MRLTPVVLWKDVPEELRWTPDKYTEVRRRCGETEFYISRDLRGFTHPDCQAATKTNGLFKPCLMPTHDGSRFCKVHGPRQGRLI
jgi:hypothetical protein